MRLLRSAVRLVLVGIPLVAATAGCFGSQNAANAGRLEGQLRPVDVPDSKFAGDLHRVLRDGQPTPERLGLLVGVVRRQLAHAAQRFESGHEARATDAVIGALYLVRVGEGRSAMVDVAGEKALAGAIDRVSSHGDEGRAEALMKMRLAALDATAPSRHVIEEHLAALTQWKKDTHGGSPMRKLGTEERAAIARALVDPTDEALEAAVRAVNDWIARAIEYNIAFRQSGGAIRPEREEAIEASRALESGGATMATLFLRNGDARGALAALDQTGARRVILPALYQHIKNAAANDSSRDWQALSAVYAQKNPDDSQEADTDIDPQLLAAGLWGTSLEAYRRDPTSFDAGYLLSQSLVRFGMPEASPLVLADGLGANPDPRAVSAALDLLINAVGESASINDLDAARRTFQAAAGLLEQGARKELRGRVEPSVARARFVMASIEVRAGNLADARPLLKMAVGDEPSAGWFTTLALVERRRAIRRRRSPRCSARSQRPTRRPRCSTSRTRTSSRTSCCATPARGTPRSLRSTRRSTRPSARGRARTRTPRPGCAPSGCSAGCSRDTATARGRRARSSARSRPRRRTVRRSARRCWTRWGAPSCGATWRRRAPRSSAGSKAT
jgi:hypothetical protein